MAPRSKADVRFCEKCAEHRQFENDKKAVRVGKDRMISSVWVGLSCKTCGFESEGIIYKKGHPFFDELMLTIGENT